MDNQHKINDFIMLAKSNDLLDIKFEPIIFMNHPYYRIFFNYKVYKGTFDVSYEEFVKASNEVIIREILRGFKVNE